MSFSFYNVLKDKESGEIRIYYTDNLADADRFEQEFDEKLETKEVIPFDSWPSSIVKEVMEGMLEDRNYHRFVKLPEIICKSLDSVGMSESCQEEVMRRILISLVEEQILE